MQRSLTRRAAQTGLIEFVFVLGESIPTHLAFDPTDQSDVWHCDDLTTQRKRCHTTDEAQERRSYAHPTANTFTDLAVDSVLPRPRTDQPTYADGAKRHRRHQWNY